MIQEWWGLSEQIKGMCNRFALAGFDALAPDLYTGVVVPYHDTDAADKQMNSLDFIDLTTQTVRGAVQYLGRNGAKVGLTGFCLGGAVTIIGAAKFPELAAGVVFYGIPPEQVAKPADVKIPLQAHFANKDDWCTPQAVDAFEKAMRAAGKSIELFRYAPSTPSSTSSGNRCTTARPPNWPGAAPRSFSGSIWMNCSVIVRRRPCERRDPYAAAIVVGQTGRRPRETTTPCGYGPRVRGDDSRC